MLLGIRHHGPGCARAVLRALEEGRPDVLLIEGPPDAAAVLPLVAHAELEPPVALLLYPPDAPAEAVYYPLAEYSPEWQALRWAAANLVPVRLMDLPQSISLALARREREEMIAKIAAEQEKAAEDSEQTSIEPGEVLVEGEAVAEGEAEPEGEAAWRNDPLRLLAQAAGYQDTELWWEAQFERRADAADLFAAILEAMRTVREEFPEPRERDLLREAHMRETIRDALKEGFERPAIVCGAWHAPVLDEEAIAGRRPGLLRKDDRALLKGLPKIKTEATWIPWTYDRLTYRSGYGAGIHSPGWYGHLWRSPERAPTRWLAEAARLLRAADLDASSAGVIEAVRLADALAALRSLRAPGLAELNEAILSVLCHGSPSPLGLIRRKLEIGERLGRVPEDAPTVPLARDLAAEQKRLRLKVSTEIKTLDLDLRKETDLAKSRLLHRLTVLGLPWGKFQQAGGKVSTFHEIWQLAWQPEFEVALIEANVWGNTVEGAAAARLLAKANETTDVATITQLLDAALLAGLDATVDPLLERLQALAAVAADVRHLMSAIPPLARVARYGDVRGTKTAEVLPVIRGLLARIFVGLPAASSGIDDDVAAATLRGLAGVQGALELLPLEELSEPWVAVLRGLMNGSYHGRLRGGCCRLLLEKQQLAEGELHRLTRLALSPATPALEAAQWLIGLISGSGLILLHQHGVWQAFDAWLRELSEDTFREMLPLLRRAFADFQPAERRQMGDKVKRLREEGAAEPLAAAAEEDLDQARAARVLPVLAQILGGTLDGDS